MPDLSERHDELADREGGGNIEYLSKSRIKTWATCPNKFRFKYCEGRRPDETEAMVRGSQIHKTFEEYYKNIKDVDGKILVPSRHLPEYTLWMDYVNPYVTNFIKFEIERGHGVPLSVEEEIWLDDPPVGDIPWMGLADAIYSTSDFLGVEGDGVVIVDFKTGDVPDAKYRNNGIFLELAYYEILFEQKYDVDATAAFYPRSGEILYNEESLKDKVINYAAQILEFTEQYTGEEAPLDEGPLCMWSPEEGDGCDFYDDCSSTWGEPAVNEETFRKSLKEIKKTNELAEEFETTSNAVEYWKYKFNL